MPFTCVLAFSLVLSFAFLSANAQTYPCNNETFSFSLTGKNVTHCKKLGPLGAEFGWNIFYSAGENASSRVSILFGARVASSHGWVAWGVNPLRPQMVGTRAFIAFKHQNGTLILDHYNITGDTKHGCRLRPSPNDLIYEQSGVDYSQQTGFLTMHLVVTLPSNYNLSTLNHVWQVGSRVDDMEPKMHATTVQNFDSCETINLGSGVGKSHHLQHLREAHGVLNIIGWGTFLPVGIIVARYFKEYPFQKERWFRWHLACQGLGFVIGTIGWALGISLGAASKAYTFRTHRIIGITIYSVAVLQMLALWLRPKKNDDYRKYWHIYHHFLGYSLFSLIVVNIFQGVHILEPAKQWKWAYVGILSGLGFIVVVLELITWITFIISMSRRKA